MKLPNFVIRYVIIPSKDIFNECGPESVGPWGWSLYDIEQRKKSAEKMMETRNKKDQFYEKLEKSILKEGFRNPILVSAGWCPPTKHNKLPPEMANSRNRILICDRHGGSRLWVAQKHNMNIPCLVSDFCNMFSEAKILEDRKDILKYFKDHPRKITINAHGLHVSKVPQIQFKETHYA